MGAVATALEERNLRRYRAPLLVAAAVRIVLGGLALLLVPIFYEEHFLWVTALRPTKEILLGGGFLARRGDVFIVPLVLVALPLLLGGVWLWYLLGVTFKVDLEKKDLPGLAGRLLPRERILDLGEALRESGWRLVFFGRLAAFPSSILAAAAGTTGMDRRTYFLADFAGALVSLFEVLLAGYLLGKAYERAGIWLTVVGVVVLVGVAVLFGRRLKATAGSHRGSS